MKTSELSEELVVKRKEVEQLREELANMESHVRISFIIVFSLVVNMILDTYICMLAFEMKMSLILFARMFVIVLESYSSALESYSSAVCCLLIGTLNKI